VFSTFLECTGSRGVENAGSNVENTGNHYFSPKYALSSLKWQGKKLLAKLWWISIQHLGLKRVSRSNKTNLSFPEKENHWSAKGSCIGFLLETPFRASILFFTVTYAYSLLLKKKDECVNSLHWFGNLFLFERIRQGYDLSPGISVRFGTSANHRIPFLNCAGSAARSFAGGCRKGPVIRATFFFNLSCNIVAVQVETLCCAYYHLRDQIVPQQNILLQISGILRVWLVSRV